MVEATIVSHQGTATVEGFDSIEEMDNLQDIRVFYDEDDYETYHAAKVVDIQV
jgi:hypothetical protein